MRSAEDSGMMENAQIMGADAARAAVTRNPRLLKGRASTLRDAVPALQAMLGKEKAA